MSKKRCFVVMGFGIKTDFATGRKLDLDKSYKLLIKPVLEQKDLICVRADEIRHSGAIDVPMYQELLNADLVIADLSTANLNAVYELGIRHALRPRTTIVISEKQLQYPFDLNHVKITGYTHLGDAIDYDEVMRFREELGKTITAVLESNEPDSPVYTFLKLIPPAKQEEAVKAAETIADALEQSSPENNATAPDSLSIIIDRGEKAVAGKKWDEAIFHFTETLNIGKRTVKDSQEGEIFNDPYLVQRLAYATYKSKKPDEISSLQQAKALVEKLDLAHTNDSETVILAGSIEKNLYELVRDVDHLEDAILFYQRAFYLLHSRYNGINLAYLLNCRADSALDKTEEERIADMVWANRIREDVLEICKKDWDLIVTRKTLLKTGKLGDKDLSNNQQLMQNQQKFWILVNRAEAFLGLGKMDEYSKACLQAEVIDHEPWMMESFTKQIGQLKPLMEKWGHLLNPKWDG